MVVVVVVVEVSVSSHSGLHVLGIIAAPLTHQSLLACLATY